MLGILQQLGVDQTFFIQFALFSGLCIFLTRVYFKPFQALFETRHKRTVEDREAAKELMETAQRRFDEYQKELADARAKARKEYEEILSAAKKQEGEILAEARDKAKKITQDASAEMARQKAAVLQELTPEIESLAQKVTDQLLRGIR